MPLLLFGLQNLRIMPLVEIPIDPIIMAIDAFFDAISIFSILRVVWKYVAIGAPLINIAKKINNNILWVTESSSPKAAARLFFPSKIELRLMNQILKY